MRAVNETNHLKFILPVAKAMTADGNDPSWVIAVCTEMIHREKKEKMDKIKREVQPSMLRVTYDS